MGASDAGTSWKQLQEAAGLSGRQQTDEQAVAAALAASEKANAFYTQFPGSSNALAARIIECTMLQTAYYHGDQQVFWKWVNLQANLAPKLSADGVYRIRLPVLRELIKRYPQKEGFYEKLLSLATMVPDDKARPIANEILTDPVSDSLKEKAKALLRRLDSVGKPLDLKFTAADGREVDISQMKGKVVLIDFWATWCVPCAEEIPLLKDTYEKFHSRGFEIVGVSSDKDEKALRNFVHQHNLPWPEYFERHGSKNMFNARFVIDTVPTLWLVDKKGTLRETSDAFPDLQARVEKLLTE
ncbi:MAG TPA: TlpA disulfide reductase family protein [Verrucomicrobiae bacterium]|nr:TlpA disulfide reductase family protein [Verrucomicrobiae bacterium]